jgi:hypothetical protein
MLGMRRHMVGPRRSRSVDAHLLSTRLLTAVALLALAGAIVSDSVAQSFWARHALLASLTASVIVVMLSVGVINEALDRRRRERWSILAQFVMFELVRNARLVWTGVLAQVGLLPPEAVRPESVDANRRTLRDTPRLTAVVRDAIADDALRRGLREEIALLADLTGEALGRWATVMLNADEYAEVIDRHVELAGDISWLIALLDNSDPPDDRGRQRRASSNPAVGIVGGIAGDALADKIVVVAQLAEELDSGTLELARRIVPIDWWKSRLGETVTPRPMTHLQPESVRHS